MKLELLLLCRDISCAVDRNCIDSSKIESKFSKFISYLTQKHTDKTENCCLENQSAFEPNKRFEISLSDKSHLWLDKYSLEGTKYSFWKDGLLNSSFEQLYSSLVGTRNYLITGL